MASEVRMRRAVSAALKGGKTTPSPTPSPTKGVVYGKIREEEKVIEQENDNKEEEDEEEEDDNKNPFGNSTSSEDESDMPIKTASPPPPPSLKNQTAPPEPPLMLPKGFREYLGNGGEGRCLGLGNTHVEGKTQHTHARTHDKRRNLEFSYLHLTPPPLSTQSLVIIVLSSYLNTVSQYSTSVSSYRSIVRNDYVRSSTTFQRSINNFQSTDLTSAINRVNEVKDMYSKRAGRRGGGANVVAGKLKGIEGRKERCRRTGRIIDIVEMFVKDDERR